jgi:hypothetical protein
MNFSKSMVMPPGPAIMKLQIQTAVKIEPWYEPAANQFAPTALWYYDPSRRTA